jgi:hypothetical protein
MPCNLANLRQNYVSGYFGGLHSLPLAASPSCVLLFTNRDETLRPGTAILLGFGTTPFWLPGPHGARKTIWVSLTKPETPQISATKSSNLSERQLAELQPIWIQDGAERSRIAPAPLWLWLALAPWGHHLQDGHVTSQLDSLGNLVSATTKTFFHETWICDCLNRRMKHMVFEVP